MTDIIKFDFIFSDDDEYSYDNELRQVFVEDINLNGAEIDMLEPNVPSIFEQTENVFGDEQIFIGLMTEKNNEFKEIEYEFHNFSISDALINEKHETDNKPLQKANIVAEASNELTREESLEIESIIQEYQNTTLEKPKKKRTRSSNPSSSKHNKKPKIKTQDTKTKLLQQDIRTIIPTHSKFGKIKKSEEKPTGNGGIAQMYKSGEYVDRIFESVEDLNSYCRNFLFNFNRLHFPLNVEIKYKTIKEEARIISMCPIKFKLKIEHNGIIYKSLGNLLNKLKEKHGITTSTNAFKYTTYIAQNGQRVRLCQLLSKDVKHFNALPLTSHYDYTDNGFLLKKPLVEYYPPKK